MQLVILEVKIQQALISSKMFFTLFQLLEQNE